MRSTWLCSSGRPIGAQRRLGVVGLALRHRQAERRHQRLLGPALAVVRGQHALDRLDPPGLVAEVPAEVRQDGQRVQRRLVVDAEPRLQDGDQGGEEVLGRRVVVAEPLDHRPRDVLDDLVRQLVEAHEQRLTGTTGVHDRRAQCQCGGDPLVPVAPQVVHRLIDDLPGLPQVAALQQQVRQRFEPERVAGGVEQHVAEIALGRGPGRAAATVPRRDGLQLLRHDVLGIDQAALP